MRRFLSRPASDEPLIDQVRGFREELGRSGAPNLLRQLPQANRLASTASQHRGRRFLAYAAQQQGIPHPRVESAVMRDYLTHLAVHQRVSASTQNQAFCAILFRCREVLGANVETTMIYAHVVK